MSDEIKSTVDYVPLEAFLEDSALVDQEPSCEPSNPDLDILIEDFKQDFDKAMSEFVEIISPTSLAPDHGPPILPVMAVSAFVFICYVGPTCTIAPLIETLLGDNPCYHGSLTDYDPVLCHKVQVYKASFLESLSIYCFFAWGVSSTVSVDNHKVYCSVVLRATIFSTVKTCYNNDKSTLYLAVRIEIYVARGIVE